MLKVNENALDYAKSSLAQNQTRLKNYRKVYALLNTVILLTAAAISILTALMVSKLVFNSFPAWFFIVTTALGAAAIMLTSFLNFFTVDKKIKRFTKNILEINAEIWKYTHKATKTYQKATRHITLYRRVAMIGGNIAAEKEVMHG